MNKMYYFVARFGQLIVMFSPSTNKLTYLDLLGVGK